MINRNPIPQNFGKIRIELTPEACQFLAGTTSGVPNWIIYNYLLCHMATRPTSFMKRGISVPLESGQVEASGHFLMQQFGVGKIPMNSCLDKMVKHGLITRAPSNVTTLADMTAVVSWTDHDGNMVENNKSLPFVHADQDENVASHSSQSDAPCVSQQIEVNEDISADAIKTIADVDDQSLRDDTEPNETIDHGESPDESLDDTTLSESTSEDVTTPGCASPVTPYNIPTQLCLEFKEQVTDEVTAPQSHTDTAPLQEASTSEVPPQSESVPEPSEEDDKSEKSLNEMFRSTAGAVALDINILQQQVAKPLPKTKRRNGKFTVNSTLADKRTKN